MTIAAISTAISVALPILQLSHASINKINQKCLDKNLPPAFEFDSPAEADNPIDLPVRGNSDYRFEGFGLVAGLPIRLSFWVHYKPDSPEHVEVGKIVVPLALSKVLNLANILT